MPGDTTDRMRPPLPETPLQWSPRFMPGDTLYVSRFANLIEMLQWSPRFMPGDTSARKQSV